MSQIEIETAALRELETVTERAKEERNWERKAEATIES